LLTKVRLLTPSLVCAVVSQGQLTRYCRMRTEFGSSLSRVISPQRGLTSDYRQKPICPITSGQNGIPLSWYVALASLSRHQEDWWSACLSKRNLRSYKGVGGGKGARVHVPGARGKVGVQCEVINEVSTGSPCARSHGRKHYRSYRRPDESKGKKDQESTINESL